MNDVQIFNNADFGAIRILDIDGKIYFVGNDIAVALGYAYPRHALKLHCKGGVKRPVLTKGGEQMMNVIPEGDVYRLVTHSKLPAAEKFESWVFDEVLPTIRKTGQYTAQQEQTAPKGIIASAVQDVADTAEVIARVFGVKPGLAIATALDLTEASHDINMTPLRKLLPSEESPSYMTATEIGVKLGGVKAREVNRMLADCGLQEKDGKDWRLTEKGKSYGEAVPFTRHGHGGYQIKWGESVLTLLD
ncbi:BRO family protein [Selenomonas sp. AB3002]|uniref:BRO-N domain-containing protein n=1 Tax=Selenomonas sp. AB3002 TaxID=1392502 RepID=UPI00068F424A